MSDAGERYCRDFLEDGKRCNCEEFTAPLDLHAPYRCRECRHGFSKHPRPVPPAGSSAAVTVEVKADPGAANQRLLDAFHQRKTSRTTGSSGLPSDSIQKAREEVLKGFRGRIDTSSKTKVYIYISKTIFLAQRPQCHSGVTASYSATVSQCHSAQSGTV
ncbi:hypothetical protein PISMIDRAFT_123146 [Pisolithus microcarpus 441]|uniref:Uncharacterized protein n=1 Tax=Pisolithus microcarpus 441 TaxID=765257 RepID=A0A0C9YLI6_9AGAM|nr:hypothetical protein BKA83DRAFT_123146 [Pisolithus microcarpus]KIK11192.1 hypothetical protein PISMIDRAFT_123146 [Pisolithus microcarpus 441]